MVHHRERNIASITLYKAYGICRHYRIIIAYRYQSGHNQWGIKRFDVNKLALSSAEFI